MSAATESAAEVGLYCLVCASLEVDAQDAALRNANPAASITEPIAARSQAGKPVNGSCFGLLRASDPVAACTALACFARAF